MSWEKGRQLASMTKNGTTLSFKYDASGLRTEKTSGNTTTKYTYVGEKLVSMKTGNTVMNFAYGADGSPYGFTYNGTSYFYLTNIQGDIIGIYNSNGNVVVEYTYDSWGKLISITGSSADTIGVKNPLRYRGYYYDTETSLYYLQARYYDPDTGRFISADALLVAGNDYIQGMNRYAYCYNNPVMYIDPTGYANEELAANIIIVISGLIYLANNLSESELKNFINENVLPYKKDLEYLSESFVKLAKGIAVSEFLAALSDSGSSVGTVADITELLGTSLGAAGNIYTGAVGFLEVLSVAFNPLNDSTDVINTILQVGTGILGGLTAVSLGSATTTFIISSGGTGILPVIAGVAVYFASGAIIDYILDNI